MRKNFDYLERGIRMNNKVKAIIFDLDDTLINYGGVTKQAWYLTCGELIENFNIDYSSDVLAEQILKVNNSIWSDEEKRPKGNFSFMEVRKKIVTEALASFDIKDAAVIEFLVSNYSRNKQAAVYVYEDVHETLCKLKERGYIICLLTNGDTETQRNKLKRFNLGSLFDYVFIDGEQGVHKPEREAYYNVLNTCHIKADEACMIGDNYLWEVEAPKKYGLNAILINRTNSIPDDCNADYTIKSISELLKIFE